MLKIIKNGAIRLDHKLILKTILIYTISLFVFSLIYYYIYKGDKHAFNTPRNQNNLDFFDFFHFSLVTQTTVGYGAMYPISNLAKIFNTIQLISIYVILIVSLL